MTVWILLASFNYEGLDNPVAGVFGHEPSKEELDSAKAIWEAETCRADYWDLQKHEVRTPSAPTIEGKPSLVDATRKALELAAEYRGLAEAYAPHVDSNDAEFEAITDAIADAVSQ